MSAADRQETRVEVAGRTLTLSNLDKVLYPVTGTTKAEVLQYYAQVAAVLLPQLADRAVTRIRWPQGTSQGSFYEKNVPAGCPRWVRTAVVPTSGARDGSGREGEVRFPVVDSLASLTYLVNLASLEFHAHQWRVDETGQPLAPDRLVIDLDPGDPAGLGECCQVALLVRDRLADDDLATVAVTSGSKGVHLYADLPGTSSAEEIRDYAHRIGDELQAEHPQLVTASMNKARRSGKVFLDWSQNTDAKTTIAPYSMRGRDRPFVAAPRWWTEIEEGAVDPLAIDQLDYRQVLRRVAAEGDVFAQ